MKERSSSKVLLQYFMLGPFARLVLVKFWLCLIDNLPSYVMMGGGWEEVGRGRKCVCQTWAMLDGENCHCTISSVPSALNFTFGLGKHFLCISKNNNWKFPHIWKSRHFWSSTEICIAPPPQTSPLPYPGKTAHASDTSTLFSSVVF